MFILNPIKYFKAIYYARQDVKEEYLQLVLNSNPAIGVRPSEFMEYLVKNYLNICRRIINHNRPISKSYSNIVQIYEKTNLDLSNVKNEISRLHKQLNEIEQKTSNKIVKLNELRQKRKEANQSGVVPVNSEIKKMSDIKKCIEIINGDLKSLRDHKEKIENEIISQNDLIVKIKAEQGAVIVKQILIFKYRLNILYEKIDVVFRKFDKIYRFYWKRLRNKSKKSINFQNSYSILEEFRSFSNIFSLCEATLIGESNIYQDEREKINTTIKNLFEYEITV